jgi:hypothetical protein
MRKSIAAVVVAACAAAPLALGVTSASATAKFTCTRINHGHKVTVMLRKNRAEDAHEAHGWTCTGDAH